jgi:hypothetical protein
VTDSNTSLARVLDTSRKEFVDQLLLPVQLAPYSATATPVEPRRAVVLNVLSNSLTVIDVQLVMGDEFDLGALLEYRHAAVDAFADLVGGLAQYLKDCLCDHLLVNCPPHLENKDLDLVAVSIRGGSVYKVCNFSRRRYVKSFPTVDYWLSLVPVLPMLREAIAEFCCKVLTDSFGTYSAAGRANQNDRLNAARMLQFLRVVQDEDPVSRLRALHLGGFSTFLRGANTGDWGTALAAEPTPEPAPEQPEQPNGGGGFVRPPIFTAPATHELILRNLLRNPVVTEDLSLVRAQPLIAKAGVVPVTEAVAQPVVQPMAQPVAEAVAQPVVGSPEHLEALVSRVASLETQLAALDKPAARTRRTAKTIDKPVADPDQ